MYVLYILSFSLYFTQSGHLIQVFHAFVVLFPTKSSSIIPSALFYLLGHLQVSQGIFLYNYRLYLKSKITDLGPLFPFLCLFLSNLTDLLISDLIY